MNIHVGLSQMTMCQWMALCCTCLLSSTATNISKLT